MENVAKCTSAATELYTQISKTTAPTQKIFKKMEHPLHQNWPTNAGNPHVGQITLIREVDIILLSDFNNE